MLTSHFDVLVIFIALLCSDHPGITILEGLAASGLRSVRYALEVNNVKRIICNDISEDAVKLMKRNIEHNKVAHLVSSSKQDARCVANTIETVLLLLSTH